MELKSSLSKFSSSELVDGEGVGSFSSVILLVKLLRFDFEIDWK